MNRIGRIVSGSTIAFLVLVALVFAQQPVSVGKNGEVELRDVTRVGTVTLQPGHYRFQHQLVDGQHFLVVFERSTVKSDPGRHYAGAVGPEVARVACTMVPLEGKVRDTALHLKKEADSTFRVTQIRISGEKTGHVVALEPQQ